MPVRRRILLLITDLEIGGTPTVVRELAARLHEPGRVHVEVACLAGEGPVADQIRAKGVHVTALGARSPRDARVLHRLNVLLGTRLIDTCFSFLVHANVAAAAASLFKRDVRYLQSVQTTQRFPRWHWLAGRIAHHAAHRVVVPSPSVAGAVERWSGVPSDKITVIPNAIDAEDFASIARKRSNGKFTVGFIGRLDPVKRIPDLLKAVASLPDEFELKIFGDGPERADLESQIRNPQSAIRNRVTLAGTIPSPKDALSQIDALVLPSEAEGFGLVLIEAMAAGIPVVATNAPGIRDVVTNDVDGLLVGIGSPSQLAEALRRLRRDSALRDRLTKAGRQTVATRYAWPAVLAAYRKLLVPDYEDEAVP
jgi:glycosyltransferase involved in cell wall biosynthesis